MISKRVIQVTQIYFNFLPTLGLLIAVGFSHGNNRQPNGCILGKIMPYSGNVFKLWLLDMDINIFSHKSGINHKHLIVAGSVSLRIFGFVKHGDTTFLTKFQPQTRAYTLI